MSDLSSTIDIDDIATAHATAFVRQAARHPDVTIDRHELHCLFARHLCDVVWDVDPDGLRHVASTTEELVAVQLHTAIVAYARRVWDKVVQAGTYDPSVAAAIHADRRGKAATRAARIDRLAQVGMYGFTVWAVTLAATFGAASFTDLVDPDVANRAIQTLVSVPFILGGAFLAIQIIGLANELWKTRPSTRT